ncbi:MAG: hypothetical protein OXU45_08130 [Candidatus Melainabacteria bacterium]|nr:hypothetical protein [Candidatus Melainabacteria bacterium]
MLSIFCLVPAHATEPQQDQDYSTKLSSLFDANQNAEIEVAELIDISQAVVNFHAEEPDPRFDINNDGKVSGQDFALIMNFAQSFTTKFDTAMKAINTATTTSLQS